jgi:hypothetical protein
VRAALMGSACCDSQKHICHVLVNFRDEGGGTGLDRRRHAVMTAPPPSSALSIASVHSLGQQRQLVGCPELEWECDGLDSGPQA